MSHFPKNKNVKVPDLGENKTTSVVRRNSETRRVREKLLDSDESNTEFDNNKNVS